MEMRNTYKIWAEKPESKRPLRKPSRGWEDYIKMGLEKAEWKVVDCGHLGFPWGRCPVMGFHKKLQISASELDCAVLHGVRKVKDPLCLTK
jgi:hypothetical protein